MKMLFRLQNFKTNNNISKKTHIYNGIFFSHKKKQILLFATTWTHLDGIMLSETSQRQILYDLTYIWKLK